MGGFTLFQELLARISALLNSFVNTAAGNAIATITPFVVAAFAVVLLWYAYKVMFGQIDQPVSQLITKCLFWSIVMSAALGAGAYQSNIADVVTSLPNDVAAAVAPGRDASEGTLGSLLDSVADTGIDKAKEAFNAKTGRFEFGKAMIYVTIGFGIIIATLILTVAGFIMLVLATTAVSFLAALGPFFIAALLFDSTRNFFWLWVGQVLYWVAFMVMFALFATFVINIYSFYLNAINVEGESWIATVVACNVVMVFGVIIFFWIPRIAGGLTGGVGGSTAGAVGGLVRTALTTIAIVKTAGAVGALKAGGAAAGAAGGAAGAAGGSARGAASVANSTNRPARNYNRA